MCGMDMCYNNDNINIEWNHLNKCNDNSIVNMNDIKESNLNTDDNSQSLVIGNNLIDLRVEEKKMKSKQKKHKKMYFYNYKTN